VHIYNNCDTAVNLQSTGRSRCINCRVRRCERMLQMLTVMKLLMLAAALLLIQRETWCDRKSEHRRSAVAAVTVDKVDVFVRSVF